jgi:hypothetical protein
MSDIKEQQLNRLVDELAARIEEDMASLYSAFMAKLLKAESGNESTVIGEYIGDRFDVRARWYLSVVRKESQLEPYLATLDRFGKTDVEALIAHFASSLPHRELVDARIVGRISYWKSEAMRRVREKAALQRVASVTSPDTAAGISNLAPGGPAPSEAAPMAAEGKPNAEATPLGTNPDGSANDSDRTKVRTDHDAVSEKHDSDAAQGPPKPGLPAQDSDTEDLASESGDPTETDPAVVWVPVVRADWREDAEFAKECPEVLQPARAMRLAAIGTLKQGAAEVLQRTRPQQQEDVERCLWPVFSEYAERVFDGIAEVELGSPSFGDPRRYKKLLKSKYVPAVVGDVCAPIFGQFPITLRYVVEQIGEVYRPDDLVKTRQVLWHMIGEAVWPARGSSLSRVETRLTNALLEERVPHWEAMAEAKPLATLARMSDDVSAGSPESNPSLETDDICVSVQPGDQPNCTPCPLRGTDPDASADDGGDIQPRRQEGCSVVTQTGSAANTFTNGDAKSECGDGRTDEAPPAGQPPDASVPSPKAGPAGSISTTPKVQHPHSPRAPRRVPDLDLSRERLRLLDALATELATLKQDLAGYCTPEELKKRHPDFILWAHLNDSEVKELVDGEPFFPKRYAEALTIRKFGLTSREALKKDRQKLLKAQRNQPNPPSS